MPSPDYRGWEKIRSLGEGGQGEVFLVRNPARAKARTEARNKIADYISVAAVATLKGAEEFAQTVAEFTRPEVPNELGALKQLKIPIKGQEKGRALQRFHNELDALKAIEDEPALLRVLESGPEEHWMISQYHPGGSLSRHPEMFKGNVRGALQALRPIIAIVAKLHEHGIVHRDIKPQNILIDRSGGLVLGDFGIVFLGLDQRPTEELERVGSRDWMAPWGHTGMRVDDVTSNFDVFPLAVRGGSQKTVSIENV